MSDKTIQLNKNVHAKLQEVSAKRKDKGHPVCTMVAILHDLILKLHKKEIDNG